MNVVLLTAIIFAVALDHGAQGQRVPCRQKSNYTMYTNFVNRHILNDNNLKRDDKASWEKYLTKKKLCGRVPVQSFIDALVSQVQRICRNGGRRVENGGNLCISNSIMIVYDVESQELNGQCRVTKLSPRQQNVVVACNNVDNLCLPVHYQAYNNPQPTTQNCS